MADRDFPDGRMQKLMGKSWTSWNLPEQPTDLDLRKLKDEYQPPEPFRSDDHQSTPIPSKFLPLFGTHPDSDFLSITKCPACGWLLKVQHANKHFLRDSRGAIVCKDSDLAIFGSKVLGRAVHPVGELKETWSRRVTLRLLPPAHTLPAKPLHTHTLRGTPSITDLVSKSRHGSGSHSNKTDYLSSHSQYRYRSHSQQMHVPTPYMPPKSRSSGSGSSLTTLGISPTGKNKSVKSSHTSTSPTPFPTTQSSLRHSLSASNSSKSSSNHKSHGTSGSYTLSIPSEDMGQNESVEDLLMSNTTQSYHSSKHVHIIATQNSKSKSTEANYDHHKYYPEVPEKRIKLDTHSRNDHHYHKSSHGHSDSHDVYSKSKSKHSSSSQTIYNGMTSDSTKKKTSSSSSSLFSKSDSSSPNKHHHLRSTTHSSIVTMTKPVVSLSSLSSQTRAHSIGSFSSSSSTVSERDRTKTSPSKKKKRKRDKDEPRKIIPLKDRDFNPDKHCGVILPGSTSPCKRSLTCKTHSIASRRGVTGRSKSFDALLAAHKMAKTEEKVPPPPPPPPRREVVVEEAPKPKKKKLSGTSSTSAAPNDLGSLASDRLGTTYARTRTPDVEVLVVKPKPKPPPPPQYDMLHCYSKKFKNCPLVYPYTPETQAKFEAVWYNPATMERNTNSAEERHKFVFLLKHYKNPFYLNCDIKPLAKNAREKRNVFSIWNASEKQVGTQHTVNWTSMDGSRRHNTEPEDLQFICLVNKK